MPLAPFVPAVFVLIWATGFVVARLVAPHVEPLTFLSLRFAIATAVLVVMARAAGAEWPRTGRAWAHAAGIGLLIQGVYLSGVFWAVRHGLPAGVSSLVVSTQPLLTAALAGPLLGERVPGRRWLGVAAGALGVVLVLAPRLGGPDGYPPAALAAAVASLVGMTLGTIWQKKVGGGLDVRAATAIQFGASLILAFPLAAATETMTVDPAPGFWVGLLWSVFGLSVGAIFLLFGMIRRGAVVSVAAWLFLVPPIATVMAHLLFGDTLAPVQLCGMAVAAAGVALATRG